jgi:hypothetical protein
LVIYPEKITVVGRIKISHQIRKRCFSNELNAAAAAAVESEREYAMRELNK